MGRVPLKNAYTIVYEKAGEELARYSVTAFNPDDAEVDADLHFAKAHPEVNRHECVSRREHSDPVIEAAQCCAR
jgi:hypothetical protein